ncbi:hypothetical protein [Emcibacter nanhaiensis]|uniref:PilN domain-containing protein n=1 Tax=Emcibacter nanhaiensis TaxID=1505037 RepID=A0A501PJH9_9PROT|nr:hypothetical protein [Emcibacter nanhaiensis]TPD60161.1 hypothetical protein FIV46_08885 [Emcibacter nanhaiensis]
MKPTPIEPQVTRLFDGPLTAPVLGCFWRGGLLRQAGWNVEKALDWWFEALENLIPGSWLSGPGNNAANLLRLEDSQTLDFTFSLPASSYRHLEDLVKLEIEERTPFRPEQVLGGYKVSPAAQAGQLSCRVVILPVRQLDGAALEGVDGLCLSTEMVLPLTANDTPWSRQHKSRSRRRLVLAGLTSSFLLLASYVPLLLSGRQLEQARAELGQIQESATQAANLQQDLNRLAQKQTAALNLRDGSPSRLRALAEIGRALDGSMEIETIEVRDNLLLLGGNSIRAAETIEKLKQLDLIRGIEFDSQVTLEVDGREAFTLRAIINGETDNDN